MKQEDNIIRKILDISQSFTENSDKVLKDLYCSLTYPNHNLSLLDKDPQLNYVNNVLVMYERDGVNINEIITRIKELKELGINLIISPFYNSDTVLVYTASSSCSLLLNCLAIKFSDLRLLELPLGTILSNLSNPFEKSELVGGTQKILIDILGITNLHSEYELDNSRINLCNLSNPNFLLMKPSDMVELTRINTPITKLDTNLSVVPEFTPYIFITGNEFTDLPFEKSLLKSMGTIYISNDYTMYLLYNNNYIFKIRDGKVEILNDRMYPQTLSHIVGVSSQVLSQFLLNNLQEKL